MSYRRNFWCLALDFLLWLGMALLRFPRQFLRGFPHSLGRLQRRGRLHPRRCEARRMVLPGSWRHATSINPTKPYIIVPAGIGRSMILLLAVFVLVTGAPNAAPHHHPWRSSPWRSSGLPMVSGTWPGLTSSVNPSLRTVGDVSRNHRTDSLRRAQFRRRPRR